MTFALLEDFCSHQKVRLNSPFAFYSGLDWQFPDSARPTMSEFLGSEREPSLCAASFPGPPGAVPESQGEAGTGAPRGCGTHSEPSHGHV